MSHFFGYSRAKSGSNRSTSRDRKLAERHSASVNLEDIIGNYDLSSRASKSTSVASFLNFAGHISQSYFSLSGCDENIDDDTTSFYSALQEGFPLGIYEPTNSHPSAQQEHLWVNGESERDMMLQATDFQVFWADLIYRIEPKISLDSLWNGIEQTLKTGVSNICNTLLCAHSGSYDIQSVQCKKEPITIIKQISGSFKSSELTAVMGPSGAGKTSLLNFISRRREDGYTGQLHVDQSNRRIKICTIPQNDHLPEYLTVKENLIFASRVKNANTHRTNQDHERSTFTVSRLLGLENCLETRTKKISGGEQKRLAIAQELLSRPDILILDEPTSGLDSSTCYKTISVLKDLVKSATMKVIDPIAILLTIHQPEQEVFDLFDRIYVMARGGTVIYNGSPSKCKEFIEKYAGIKAEDDDYNPASFLIEIASGEYGDEPITKLAHQVKLEADVARERIIGKSLYEKLNQSGLGENSSNKNTKTARSDDEERITPTKEIKQKSTLYIDQRIVKGSSINSGNFWKKTRALSERQWLSIIRDPKQMIARILFHVLFPIFLGLIMGGEPGGANACPNYSANYTLKELVNDGGKADDVQEELMLTLENVAQLFVLIYALISANIGIVTLSFTIDMRSSLKEYHNGWYSMPSYIFARVISELPMEVFLPILTVALGYQFTNQTAGSSMSTIFRVAITSLAIILATIGLVTMGMIFGAIYLGHLSTALFVSQGFCLPMVFLSGFVVRTKHMSKFLYTLSQLSFFRHTLEITTIARYGFKVCSCDPKNILPEGPQISDVPERLKTFTKFWLDSMGDQDTSEATANSSNAVSETGGSSNQDMFKLFAKQISLYNTYGIEIKSCDDIKPFQLHTLSISENDLATSFLALVVLIICMKILLIFTVKIVLHLKTSL